MPEERLAIDFGTSNSAVALVEGGYVRRIAIEGGNETLPTAVFFPSDGGQMRFGAEAASALIDGEDGRYMRALKSVLGLPLLHEPRVLGGQRQTLADVIARFLTELRARTEAATGRRFTRVLSGRPVHFHTARPERDAQAEADLRACYEKAGFDDIAFLPEPEAAVHASHRMGAKDTLGLIVDIGGGTSDFSVFEDVSGQPRILASHGVRLGGTDFDRTLSIAHAMPALGLGGELRRAMGRGLLPVPRGPYVDLATWPKIPFVYTPENRRMVADMVKHALEPGKIARLATVLDLELGHELAFAVEAGKIATNGVEGAGRIEMDFIEPGLGAPLSRAQMDETLGENRAELSGAAAETVRLAGVAPERIGRVILVGGSSLMTFVSDAVSQLCPNAQILRSEAFTGVVDGLALAARLQD